MVTRTDVEFAQRVAAARVGNPYVYGGCWVADDESVGTDCSGLAVGVLDAVVNGPAGMGWSRHGMSTESWRPVQVGERGPFGTICVAHPSGFPADAVVKIALHHGPGGGMNSHMWVEVDGVRHESNGDDGHVTGPDARNVYDTAFANDWAYLPGPIEGTEPVPVVDATDPVFGIDVSNHQGAFSFAQAHLEGLEFATHKVTEGDFYADPYWGRALNQMREYFPNRFGGYVFCRTNVSPEREVEFFAKHCPVDVPVQIDYEDTTNGGSLPDLLARVQAYQVRGYRLLPIYLPRWFWSSRMGSPSLAGLPVGIWNSHYVGGDATPDALYPGDGFQGWDAMGGKPVQVLQFSETATVAGQRIDVNAIRGGLAAVDRLFNPVPSLGEIMASFSDEELSKKFPSRSKYRDSQAPIDTLAGFVLNIDARIHEEFVERQALLGVPEFVELVRREAVRGDLGAKAVLAKVPT